MPGDEDPRERDRYSKDFKLTLKEQPTLAF
jgi:hypothetical protein